MDDADRILFDISSHLLASCRINGVVPFELAPVTMNRFCGRRAPRGSRGRRARWVEVYIRVGFLRLVGFLVGLKQGWHAIVELTQECHVIVVRL